MVKEYPYLMEISILGAGR